MGGRLVDEASLPWPLLPLDEYLETAANILRRGEVAGVEAATWEGKRVVAALKLIGVAKIPLGGGRYSLEDLGLYDDLERNTARVYDSLVSLVRGSWPTPLLKSRAWSGGTLYLKLESMNPASLSVKDRAAWMMLETALERGIACEEVCEASSGNTGIALAALAAALGARATIIVPQGTREEVKVYLKALGAQVVESEKGLTVETLREVELLAEERGCLHLNQFVNDANFIAHVRYTGRELDYQLRSIGARPTLLAAGIGTSGHLSGTAFYLANRYPGLRVVAAQPAPGERIPGLRRVETKPRWLKYAGRVRLVEVTLEEAVGAALRIARSDGVLVGPSTGAALVALEEAAEEGVAVLVSPDTGFKYPSVFSSLV